MAQYLSLRRVYVDGGFFRVDIHAGVGHEADEVTAGGVAVPYVIKRRHC